MRRLLLTVLFGTALSGCAGSTQTPGACPGLIAVLNLALISPATNAINVPDNQPGITVQGAIPDTSAIVTLTPSNGGAPLTAVTNPLFPIPQPGPTQYNLALPALGAHTTYTVSITSSHMDAGCTDTSMGSPGSFTTL
jgi:hypothetical protein